MKRSDAVRLLTAFINLNTHKTIDEFSGDYMCSLEEGSKVLSFLEKQGILPPPIRTSENGINFRGEARGPAISFIWEPEEQECICDARFSGLDEAEFCARGCPNCTCNFIKENK